MASVWASQSSACSLRPLSRDAAQPGLAASGCGTGCTQRCPLSQGLRQTGGRLLPPRPSSHDPGPLNPYDTLIISNSLLSSHEASSRSGQFKDLSSFFSILRSSQRRTSTLGVGCDPPLALLFLFAHVSPPPLSPPSAHARSDDNGRIFTHREPEDQRLLSPFPQHARLGEGRSPFLHLQ